MTQGPKANWNEIARVVPGDKPKTVSLEYTDGRTVMFETDSDTVASMCVNE